MESISGQMEDLSKTTELMNEAAQQNTRVLISIRQETLDFGNHLVQTTNDNLERIAECAEDFEERTRRSTEELEKHVAALKTIKSTKDCDNTPTYREAFVRGGDGDMHGWKRIGATGTGDPKLARVEAQAALRDRQLLINTREGGRLAKENMGPKNIVERANEVLARMEPPEALRGTFTAALHLRNGTGILLEVKNAGTVGWLRETGRRAIFTEGMEEGATIKDRTFTLMVPFVPLSLRPERETDLREIEEQNDLKEGDISGARWIKPVHRRAENQLVAHLLLIIKSAGTANRLIKNGMAICQKRVHPKKLKRKPIQCLKCQIFGHIATTCTIPLDIRGTCTAAHKTSDCTAYKTERCVSCQTEGHTSWSRNCPTFIRKCREMDERTPENNMPYFPTEQEWTHVAEPTQRAPPPPPLPTPPQTAEDGIPKSKVAADKIGKGKDKQEMYHFGGTTQQSKLRQTTLSFSVRDADTATEAQITGEAGPSSTQVSSEMTQNAQGVPAVLPDTESDIKWGDQPYNVDLK
jgi:hypothetical protein